MLGSVKMATGVGTHYAMLGVAPDATADEIERAFTGRLTPFMAQPFGATAIAAAAYAVLRDPEKRRAYDRSIGIAPARVLPPGAYAYSDGPILDRSAVATPAPEPVATPARETFMFPPAETAAQAEPPMPVGESTTGYRIPIDLDAAFRESVASPSGEGWRNVALIAGALVLGAVTIGAWAGMNSGAAADETTGSTRVELPPPAEKPFVATDTPPLVAAPPTAPLRASRRPPEATRSRVAAPSIPRALDNPAPAVVVEAASEPVVGTAAAPVSEPVPPVTAAAMPLSNGVIASTIRKIGYPCGSVASTTAVDGAAGNFTITCTSGHSYRAAPVNGRYRFRKLAN